MKNSRLLFVVLFHTIFSAFGDIQSSIINYMAVPLRTFFERSLKQTYGIEPNSEIFELFYSIIASSFYGGVFLVGIIMAICMEKFGRKGTAVYLRSCLGILSSLAMITAKWLDRPELFLIGHFLSGMVQTLKTVLFIYMAECSPSECRGWTTTAIGSGGGLILLIFSPLCMPNVLGNENNWWLIPAICLLLAMCHLFLAGFYLPESPKHLFIGENNYLEAQISINFYYGKNAEIEQIFDEFNSEELVVHRKSVVLSDFWISQRLRWATAITMLVAFVPAFSFAALKGQYLESMLIQFGLNQSTAMISIIVIAALCTPFSILAPILIESKGRRPLFLTIILLSSIELALVALSQYLFNKFGSSWIVAGIALIGCSIGQTSINLGMLNMNPMLISELFPYQSRSKATQVYN
ncbi:MFS domain-containing protein [Meloidogyne graminicola]|uniref:MFS domain-containing protein n=1 Tax=Meloidogyne graminicola TaxID=189291 RepID=A0A8S9ZVW7_9BILA|nr:MFS domain-containing protein [Meloidogyne graminicola]